MRQIMRYPLWLAGLAWVAGCQEAGSPRAATQVVPAGAAVHQVGDAGEKPADQSKPAKLEKDNQNTLIKAHRNGLTLSASSIWSAEWPVRHAFDGNLATSWFSAKNDTAAHGAKPFVQVAFPAPVTVQRVTIMGNRDPQWPRGYTILAGTIELLDANGKQLALDENDGRGELADYDWKLPAPVRGVHAIRFNALGDQGKENPYDDIAIGEFLVE